MALTNRGPDAEMVGKDKPIFRASHHMNAITFLLIGIIITTTILYVFTLFLNQNHTATAQQQKLHVMQNNRTSSSLTNQQLLNGNSFQIDNMTFSHRTASYDVLSSYCFC
jgi:hypothetical protein